jgi:hypothetical protein
VLRRRLSALVADECVMGAPPYWTNLEGKLKVVTLLSIILDVIPDFTYHRHFVNGNDIALEFRGRVLGSDKHSVQGMDLITLDENGQLASIDVMIRPLSSLVALKAAVRERITPLLEKLQSKM